MRKLILSHVNSISFPATGMRRLLLCLTLVVFVAQGALPQITYRKVLCTITNFTRTATDYSFEIWAKNDSTVAFFVGNCDYYFKYTASALSTPVLSNINSKYTGIAGVDNYDPMQADILGGRIHVAIRFSGSAGGSSSLSSSVPIGERICTVSLTITNSSLSPSLTWDSTNTAMLTTGTSNVIQRLEGFDDSPLPIQLASFTAMINPSGAGVRLDWITLTELNNYGFYVQRHAQGQTEFTDLPNSFIPGHGTTTEPHSYSYIDATASAGNWWYRLKQVDLDATVHYSDGVQVEILTSVPEPAPRVFALMQNYPNPFNPSTEIKFSVENTAHTTLRVYNVIGQLIGTLYNDVAEAGRYYKARLDGANLASGLYFYKLESGKQSSLHKMLLVK